MSFQYNDKCKLFDKISTWVSIVIYVSALVVFVLSFFTDAVTPIMSVIGVAWLAWAFLDGILYHYKAKVITLPVEVEFTVQYEDITPETRQVIKSVIIHAANVASDLKRKAVYEKKQHLLTVGTIQMLLIFWMTLSVIF